MKVSRLFTLIAVIFGVIFYAMPGFSSAQTFTCNNYCTDNKNLTPDTPNWVECCSCVTYCEPLPPLFQDFQECYTECMATGPGNSSSGGAPNTCPCQTNSQCFSGEQCYLGVCYAGNSAAQPPCKDSSGGGSGSGGMSASGGSGMGSDIGIGTSGGATGGSSSSSQWCQCQSNSDCVSPATCVAHPQNGVKYCTTSNSYPAQCTPGSSSGASSTGGNSANSGNNQNSSSNSNSSSGSGSGGTTSGGATSGGATNNTGSGYCPQSQTQCSTQLSNLWSCAFAKCGKLYSWCGAAHAPCNTQLQAANSCIDLVCNTPNTPNVQGGPIEGFTNVPWEKNAVSATADTPEHGQNPVVAPFDLTSNRGPQGGETLQDMRSQYLSHPFAKGGSSDWRAFNSAALSKNLADRIIKPCFYGAGQAEKDYYDNNILPNVTTYFTGKIEEGQNFFSQVPTVDCAWLRNKAGF